jgi:hypothetical protein
MARGVSKAYAKIDVSALGAIKQKQREELFKDLARDFFRRRINSKDRRLSGAVTRPLKAALKDLKGVARIAH